MAKMTVQRVDALKAKDKPYKINVDVGLQIRVSISGVKTLIVQYVVDGKQREYRLPKPWGTTTNDGRISLADARTKAEEIRSLARQNIDYQIQQERARADEVQADIAERAAQVEQQLKIAQDSLTVGDLFSAWLADGVQRKDGNAELTRTFKADVLPIIGNIPIKNLTEHDLRGVLRTMVARGVNRSAVIMRNNLTQMFAWAEKRQPWRKSLSDGNPVELIEIEKIVSPDYAFDDERTRIFSPDEIREMRAIFDRMQSDFDEAPDRRNTGRPILKTTQLGVWIMLSTTCRVGEMIMSRWEHVDLVAGTWFIPKSNVKDNVADLTVRMSDFSREQFVQLQKITGQSEWCFPSRNGEGHVCTKSITKQVGDRQSRFKKAKDGTPRKQMKGRTHDNTLVLADGKNGAWTPHDLRRTGATMMQSLGVPLDVIDRCQNHVLAGSKVRRAYLHHDYKDEMRAAWQLLGEHLAEILTQSDKIVAQVRKLKF